jgi:hypothetical protein
MHSADKFKYLLIGGVFTIAIILFSCATDKSSSTSSKSAGPFQAQYVARLAQPEVVIKNQSAKVITLELTGPESRTLTIPPHSTESMIIKGGTYNYHAEALGVIPASGSQSFEKQHRYTWVFYIRTITY